MEAARTSSSFFVTKGTKVHLKRNALLFSPDKPIHFAYYLQKGRVKQYGLTPDGAEYTIHIYAPGSFFPLTSVVNDIPNSYFFQAVTDCILYQQSKSETVEYLRSNPEALFNLSTRLLSAIDKLSLRIGQLAYASASEKIQSIFIFLSHHFATEDKKGKLVFSKRITHEDIAALAGLSRETVSREIKKLKARGFLQYQKGRIVLEPQIKTKTSNKK